MEFGSDFHYIDTAAFSCGTGTLASFFPDSLLFGDGRECLVALIRQQGWKRMWAPSYFCHEVLDSVVAMTGIRIAFYPDDPLREFPAAEMASLPFQSGDFLLRMNYFGCRGYRSPEGIPVPVVEDHSHDLTGPWALGSQADWCIASLRKSLPVPDGGILWSPKGHALPEDIRTDAGHEKRMETRWKAMKMKAAYLRGEKVEKTVFRDLFIRTEQAFDQAGPASICDASRAYLASFDVQTWYARKRENRDFLTCRLAETGIRFLSAETDDCHVFSLLPVAKDASQRDVWKARMIRAGIYPAVLWVVPRSPGIPVTEGDGRLLSIHCDGRYSLQEMARMADILEEILTA